jgi:hypothetical protein
VAWSRKFDEPIVLPDGRKLMTLRDAADYNGPAEGSIRFTGMAGCHNSLGAALESEPTTLARIAIMRALNSSSFNPPQRYQS